MILILTISASWARSPRDASYFQDAIIDSKSPGKIALGFKNYEDIRIDSDLDGKVDFWYLRSGDTEAGIRYKDGLLKQITIKKVIPDDTVKEAILVNIQSKLEVVSIKSRPILTLNGKVVDVCMENKSVLNTDAAKTSVSIKDSILLKNISTYIDDSCFESVEPETTKLLSSSLQDVFSDALSSSENSFHNCLSGPTAKNLFKQRSSDSKVALDFLSTKMSLDLKKIAQTPSSGSRLFFCKIDSSLNSPKASFTESSGITLTLPNDAERKISNKDLSKLFRHELLHRSGLLDEATIERLADICPRDTANKKPQKLDTNDKSSGNLTPENIMGVVNTTPSSQAASVKDTAVIATNSNSSRTPASSSATGGGSSGLDMKAEIAKAEAVIPSAEKLAKTKIDKSPEGIQTAVKESLAESAPVLRMANQVMGASNTPAIASSGGGSSSSGSEVARSVASTSSSYEPSSSTSGSSSSESRSSRRYQRTSRYESSSETVASSEGPKVITTKSRNGLAAGERVVEEIDLTKGTNYKATSSSATGQQGNGRVAASNRVTAGNREPASAAVPAAPSNPGGEVAAPGPINTGSSGSLGSFSNASEVNSSGSTGNNRRTSGNRGPASSGSTRNSTTSSREEVVTFLSNGSYSQTKNKLRESGFINTLKSNKVTIIDLYGNSFGASRGDVIFLDDGNKFVRQK